MKYFWLPLALWASSRVIAEVSDAMTWHPILTPALRITAALLFVSFLFSVPYIGEKILKEE